MGPLGRSFRSERCGVIQIALTDRIQQLDLADKLTIEGGGEQGPVIQGVPVRFDLGAQSLSNDQGVVCGPEGGKNMSDHIRPSEWR